VLGELRLCTHRAAAVAEVWLLRFCLQDNSFSLITSKKVLYIMQVRADADGGCPSCSIASQAGVMAS
jgi:hypothetical protein